METEVAIRSGTMQVTALCLIASGMVLALGVAGVQSTPALVGFLVVLSVGLYLTRPSISVGHVLKFDVDSLLRSLWLAPLVAALPLVVELGATPGEMQALGGLLGLAGMANYFLRPVYLLVYDVVEKLTDGNNGPAER